MCQTRGASPCDPVFAACDVPEISRAVDNLLINAIEARALLAERSPCTPSKQKKSSLIRIEDEGLGVDASVVSVFSSRLSLVARRERGSAWPSCARSHAPTAGKRDTSQRRKVQPSRSSSHGNHLIVDDDTAMRESLSETLADLGHQPVAKEGGQAALDYLRTKTVDAVLLDLRMPGLDGIEVLTRIQTLSSRRLSSCSPLSRRPPIPSKPCALVPSII